jgi:hypothetical protein
VEASNQSITTPSAVYKVGDRRMDAGSLEFAEAIADAHASHQRPRCMCLAEGVEMYVARLGAGYIVKRMPDTGGHHAPDCPSYQPPPEFSGLGQVLGSAIKEDPATGDTVLKLDFPLTKLPGRSQPPSAEGESDVATSDGTKLSLRGLLHYLWDEAELTRWHPGFTGKRTWSTVRGHLHQAAEHKLAGSNAVRDRLYVPEPFSVDQRAAINARRLAHWQGAMAAAPGRPQQLMLLIGEVKEIVPARYGFKAVIKHVPDQAFLVDASLYRRLERCFGAELAMWSTEDDIHMVMIATFGANSSGVAAIDRLCLMPTNRQWLPVDHIFGKRLVDKLVAEARSFIKGLRYNLRQTDEVAFALLTDCGSTPTPLIVLNGTSEEPARSALQKHFDRSAWTWRCAIEPLPDVPSRTTSERSSSWFGSTAPASG